MGRIIILFCLIINSHCLNSQDIPIEYIKAIEFMKTDKSFRKTYKKENFCQDNLIKKIFFTQTHVKKRKLMFDVLPLVRSYSICRFDYLKEINEICKIERNNLNKLELNYYEDLRLYSTDSLSRTKISLGIPYKNYLVLSMYCLCSEEAKGEVGLSFNASNDILFIFDDRKEIVKFYTARTIP